MAPSIALLRPSATKHTRKVAEGFGDAAEASARLMLIAALSDLVAEISDALDDREVKLVARDADVDVGVRCGRDRDPSEADKGQVPGFEELTGDISRVMSAERCGSIQ